MAGVSHLWVYWFFKPTIGLSITTSTVETFDWSARSMLWLFLWKPTVFLAAFRLMNLSLCCSPLQKSGFLKTSISLSCFTLWKSYMLSWVTRRVPVWRRTKNWSDESTSVGFLLWRKPHLWLRSRHHPYPSILFFCSRGAVSPNPYLQNFISFEKKRGDGVAAPSGTATVLPLLHLYRNYLNISI